MALKNKFAEKRAPLLEERFKVLQGTEEAKTTGTPACRGFWLMAMQNHPAFDDMIEEYDCPVLEYLTDIKVSYPDKEDHNKGFKLEFLFAENPYFEHKVLDKSYFTKEESPYTGNIEATEIKATKIEWKSGKDVTIEKVKGKKSKMNAKGKNKDKTEARPSFFRSFFRNLKEGDPLPDDIDPEELKLECDSDDEPEDDEGLMEMLLVNDHECGTAVRDDIVPWAVRWYTGEACPDDDDDEDEAPPPPKKKGDKATVKKDKRKESEGKDEKKEECKQQ